MYFSSDKLYKLSKEALRGRKQEEVYERLIHWVNLRYKINAIYVDFNIESNGKQSKLHLILKDQSDYQKMLDNSGYNSIIQDEIAGKFREILREEDSDIDTKIIAEKVFKFFRKPKTNIWVCYSNFINVYSAEISTELTKNEIKTLVEKYKVGNIWEIHTNGFYITVFFEKESHIEENKENLFFENLKREYFEIVKQKDEFGFFKKDKIILLFDSKENFDKNFESNWYYYYK
jgi:putative heme iron utilization protein